MEDDVDAVERPLDRGAIDQVALDELDAVAQVGEILAMARAQIVEHANPIAALDERRRDVRTDETRAAGNQVRCPSTRGYPTGRSAATQAGKQVLIRAERRTGGPRVRPARARLRRR